MNIVYFRIKKIRKCRWEHKVFYMIHRANVHKSSKKMFLFSYFYYFLRLPISSFWHLYLLPFIYNSLNKTLLLLFLMYIHEKYDDSHAFIIFMNLTLSFFSKLFLNLWSFVNGIFRWIVGILLLFPIHNSTWKFMLVKKMQREE